MRPLLHAIGIYHELGGVYYCRSVSKDVGCSSAVGDHVQQKKKFYRHLT